MKIKNIFRGKNLLITILLTIVIVFLFLLFLISKVTIINTKVPIGKQLTKIEKLTCKETHYNSFGKYEDFDTNNISIGNIAFEMKEEYGSYRTKTNEWKPFRTDIMKFTLYENRVSLKYDYENALQESVFDIKVNDKNKLLGTAQSIQQYEAATAINSKVLILDKATGHMIISETISNRISQIDDLNTRSKFYTCN